MAGFLPNLSALRIGCGAGDGKKKVSKAEARAEQSTLYTRLRSIVTAFIALDASVLMERGESELSETVCAIRNLFRTSLNISELAREVVLLRLVQGELTRLSTHVTNQRASTFIRMSVAPEDMPNDPISTLADSIAALLDALPEKLSVPNEAERARKEMKTLLDATLDTDVQQQQQQATPSTVRKRCRNTGEGSSSSHGRDPDDDMAPDLSSDEEEENAEMGEEVVASGEDAAEKASQEGDEAGAEAEPNNSFETLGGGVGPEDDDVESNNPFPFPTNNDEVGRGQTRADSLEQTDE